MNDPLIENLKQVRKTIPSAVRLIAVSKKVPPEIIELVYQQGIRDFAENKLQEALRKQAQLSHLTDICWHFIGHLQTNKAKKAVQSFAWIHSVDSLRLAQCLNSHAQKLLQEAKIHQLPQVCLQVKVRPDEHKYGWSVDGLLQDLSQLQQLQSLSFRNLIAILPLGLSSLESLSAFQDVAQLAQTIRNQGYFSNDFDQLSLGMSGDYLLAIEAGATMVRLGSIIFNS